MAWLGLARPGWVATAVAVQGHGGVEWHLAGVGYSSYIDCPYPYGPTNYLETLPGQGDTADRVHQTKTNLPLVFVLGSHSSGKHAGTKWRSRVMARRPHHEARNLCAIGEQSKSISLYEYWPVS